MLIIYSVSDLHIIQMLVKETYIYVSTCNNTDLEFNYSLFTKELENVQTAT